MNEEIRIEKRLECCMICTVYYFFFIVVENEKDSPIMMSDFVNSLNSGLADNFWKILNIYRKNASSFPP